MEKPSAQGFMQKRKNDAIVAVVRAAVAVAARTPARALIRTGEWIGRVAFFLLPRERRTALENLARAFPNFSDQERRSLAKRAYVTLGHHLGATALNLRSEKLEARRTSEKQAPIPFAEGSREVLQAAIAGGRGVLLASAHLGPYEHVAASLVLHGTPLLAVTKRAYDPRLDFVYARLRGSLGVPQIARDAPGAGFAMVRHLRKGRVLGIPMDLASRVPSVDAPFFDEPARTAVGPARLALRTGARVVVCTVAPPLHADAKAGEVVLTVTAIETADLHDDASNANGSAETQLTARINEELSRRIRALPEAWPWMHPRFANLARASSETR